MTATAVREKPILFSGSMVRAILEGRKTQTRRICKPQPLEMDSGQWFPGPPGDYRNALHYASETHLRKGLPLDFCPYGRVGDLLWVREGWWHYKSPELEMAAYADGTSRTLLDNGRTHDEPQKEIPCNGRTHWHPESYPNVWRKRVSIHMPRWASRITLEITDVRVQRLQEISEEDARAEGSYLDRCPCMPRAKDAGIMRSFSLQECHIHGSEFKYLWDSINAIRAPWQSNPWVWAITFKRLENSI